jgi:hypothetical protein
MLKEPLRVIWFMKYYSLVLFRFHGCILLPDTIISHRVKLQL